MRRKIFFTLSMFALTIICSRPATSLADETAHRSGDAPTTPFFSVSVEAGVNAYKGDFKWSDSGENGFPDIGADYNVYDFEADGQQISLQFEVFRGWLKNTVWEFSSSSSDIDEETGNFGGIEYAANHRTSPQNATSAALRGDDLSDTRLTVGYVRRTDNNILMAYTGVIDAEHNFLLSGSAGSSASADYAGSWEGLLFGVSVSEQAGKHQVSLRAEYHIPDYEAELNWGLRDFTATHEGDARISIFTLRYDYWVFDFVSLWLSASSHDWQVDDGSVEKRYSNGSTEVAELDKLRWQGLATAAGLKLRF